MDIKNLKLNAYGDIDLKANVEEELDDIELGVLYSVHGDDYFLVKVKNGGFFKYGYFVNLRHSPDINSLGPEYIRKPELFKKPQTCAFGNFDKIAWDIKYFTEEKELLYGWPHIVTKIYENAEAAQRRFDNMLADLEEEYAKGYYYNKELRRNDILTCLEKNNIATDENLEKLKSAKLTSKDADGFDGIAAKKLLTSVSDSIFIDNVKTVIRNGRELDKSEWFIVQKEDNDIDGFPVYVFPLDQFDKDVAETTRAKIINEIKNLRDTLDEIEGRLSEADLNKLYSVLDVLNGAYIYWPEDEDVYDDDEENNDE